MMTLPDLSDYILHTTEHYLFLVRPGSPAHRDIAAIAREQEACYARITAELGVTPGEPLRYILCDSPKECAAFWKALFDDDSYEELNGFADCPIAVYAVYSDEIRCIGAHEDAHLISSRLGLPQNAALCEGLAMYFDGAWWGEDNEAWVRRYLAGGQYLPLRQLLDNDVFYAQPCEITYPIAGAFTRYVTAQSGMEAYLHRVWAHCAPDQAVARLEALLGKPLCAIEQDFLTRIKADFQT